MKRRSFLQAVGAAIAAVLVPAAKVKDSYLIYEDALILQDHVAAVRPGGFVNGPGSLTDDHVIFTDDVIAS